MKLFITSAFLVLSALAQEDNRSGTPIEFFTLSPVESPTENENPTLAPVTETDPPVAAPSTETPSAAPIVVAITAEPTVVVIETALPTIAPTALPTPEPVTVSPAPTTAPVTAFPTTSSPTKLPTSKAPTTGRPVTAVFDDSSDFPTISNIPSDSPSDAPSDSPNSDVTIEQSAQCLDNSQCAVLNLTGACCPTMDDWNLRCCGEPDVPHYQSCLNHTKCDALELEDACCPTADGKWLDCCGSVPDKCQEPGVCPLYSSVQYKLDLESGSSSIDRTASGAVAVMASTAASTLLVVVIAFVAL